MMSELVTASVGWSADADAAHAGRDAAAMALKRLAPAMPRMGIVLISSWLDQTQFLYGVREILRATPIAGESTAGEIIPEGPISHSGVVVLLSAPSLQCSIGVGEHADQNPREAGQQAAYTAIRAYQGNTRKGFLVFSDGLLTTSGDVIRGVQEVVGTSSLIVGSLAGDDLRFARTYQYANERAVTRSVVGVLLGGSMAIGVGNEHGFAPISKPRRITHSQANVLHTLDGQPAASVYEEYFGSDVVERMRHEGMTRQSIAYPLGVQLGEADEWRMLRNVVSFGEDGSLVCSGEIPEGAWLQLMLGSRQLALEAAARATQHAIQSLNHVACVLVFESVARRILLGPQQAGLEIAKIRELIGPTVPLAGCYTYGEHGPLRNASTYGRSAVQTGSILLIAVGT